MKNPTENKGGITMIRWGNLKTQLDNDKSKLMVMGEIDGCFYFTDGVVLLKRKGGITESIGKMIEGITGHPLEQDGVSVYKRGVVEGVEWENVSKYYTKELLEKAKVVIESESVKVKDEVEDENYKGYRLDKKDNKDVVWYDKDKLKGILETKGECRIDIGKGAEEIPEILRYTSKLYTFGLLQVKRY